MVREIKEKEGFTPKGQGFNSEKMKTRKRPLSDMEEPSSIPPKKMLNSGAEEPEFSYIRFKFLLRSPDTVMKGLQTFLDVCEGDKEEGEGGRKGLLLLDSYLKSSPECSEVMDLLTPKSTSQEVSLVFTWVKVVLQKCPSVVEAFPELQQHLVKTVLTQHCHLVVNSLRRGNKASLIKSTLLLLIAIASLGGRFAKQLHTHLDFTHANWPSLLSRRDRKDEIDVRACMTAILMTLLQEDDEEVTKTLVDQQVLLQDVLLGLKYDRSEYVMHSLNTIHRCIVLNGAIGKSSKMYLFNSPVLKELLALYQWLGPSQWKSQPSDDKNEDYTEEQQQVAGCVHPVLVDLLTNHKLGICFRDKSYGMTENRNPALSKVLLLLVTSYTSPSPLLQQLATAIIAACPDQTTPFLKLLHPHLSPRPVHSWIACLAFFLKMVEKHQWPGELTSNADLMTEERGGQVVLFLFPPEPIVTSLKEGLKSSCATVRHQCLQALEVIVAGGRRFIDVSKSKLGGQAPLTLGIEGFVSRTLPNGQVLLNLQQKLSSADSFAIAITRDLHKDKDVVLPHVSRFQHLLAILRMYSLAPQHLTGGSADILPGLLQLVAKMVASDDAIDQPPNGTPASLPSLYLLQALSECDARKLNLFGKGGNKADPVNSLVYQLVTLMQVQSADDAYTHTARSLIVKLLAGTGLFEGQEQELGTWLRHLQRAASAPSEVVAFFVGVLRQYMSNPYPAIDRMLELVEDAPQVTDDHAASVRQEFSPLVMFALDGEFHAHKKVHQYLCTVLMDILHTLHKPQGFSRLVHSLSSDLAPEVTLYLTLHSADETLTSESMATRMCRKTRVKQLKTFKHPGVSLMKKLLKGNEEEGVEEVVENLSPSACLPLIQLCLRYLDELVLGSVSTEGELVNPKLGEVCGETLRAACLRLAATASTNTEVSADKNTEVSADENTEVSADENTEVSADENTVVSADKSTEGGPDDLHHAAQLETDWFGPAVTCVLGHPLVSRWLLEEGFQQGGRPTERVVTQLCAVVQDMRLGERGSDAGLALDVAAKCRRMLQAASGSSSSGEACQLSEEVQPLLCRCLETLFSVGGRQGRVEGLLTLVSLPAENFVTTGVSSKTPSPLADTVRRLAEQAQQDGQALKGLSSRVDVESALKGLFTLVSFLDDSRLASLALSWVQSSPELSAACPVTALQGMLKRLERGEAAELFPLLECVMLHNAQCRAACAQWLHRKRKSLRQGKPLFHSIMLLYLRQFGKADDDADDDAGVEAIAEAVRSRLDDGHVTVGQLDPTFLHVVCYLVTLHKMEPSWVDQLQEALLSAMGEGQGSGLLHKAHVQLLAATLRQQSLTAVQQDAAGGRQEGARQTSEGGWDKFEAQAGQALLTCVRYLTSGGRRAGRRQPAEGEEEGEGDEESCRSSVGRLCRDLLCLTVPGDVRAAIMTFWPDVVTCCLKYHYKDVQYIALLRQLVQRLFTEEERATKDDTDLEEEDDIENITINDSSDESSDSEGDDEDDKGDEDESMAATAQQSSARLKSASSSPKRPSPATPQRKAKTLRTIVSESARRLRLNEKSAAAKKCVALFDEEGEGKPSTRQRQIVRRWTESTLQTFFLWPSESAAASSQATATLASPSHGRLLVDLCEKVVGHTGFLSVMQEEDQRGVRGELVGLLACLVRLHQACCCGVPLSVLVAAYGATLSLTDQNLLYLMFACDLYGNQRFSPGLWGERVVQELQTRRETGRSLLQETSLESVLQALSADVMATSILHFPLLRSMEFRVSECAVKAERMLSREDCYDPRFLLRLFFHFMGPEYIVDVRTFIAQRALGLTLAALSSHDWETRQVAIGVLANLHSHLEMVQRWTGAPMLLAVLKVVRYGMTKLGQKLPCVITHFLARAADFIMSPESDMYVAIHSFLMLKPALDISNVPEFYNFFNSPNPKERLWILRLLQEGLRETSDHHLFQRRFVYKLLMCHANSSLSDPQTRRESLKVLVKACTVSTVVRDLVVRHGLLPWLLTFIKDMLPDTSDMTRVVCQLLHCVCYTAQFNGHRLWWLSLPRLSRRCLLHTPLLSCVSLLLHGFSHLDERSVSMLDEILQHPHLATPSTPTLLLPQRLR